MAILGIDEVGRGPLAGPLVVGAVILPEVRSDWVEELRDSKKLSAKKREKLSEIILNEAPATGLGWVSPVEIDELGMSGALKLAAKRAVREVLENKPHFTEVIIDGNMNFLVETPFEKYTTTVIKGDSLIKEISAASIIAKVARDAYMVEAGARFPEYGFEKHVGYGTSRHLAAIREFGICPEHRKSFEPIKSMVGFERSLEKDVVDQRSSASQGAVKNTTLVGKRGEEAVREYLVGLGHKIVERNFKTYFYEIDIVSVCEGKIYFTEVKTRRDDLHGGGLAAIDKKKLQQMKYAAECFLKYKRKYNALDPLLAVASVNGNYQVLDWFPLDFS